MYKKLLIGFGIILSIIFSFTFCFANEGIDKSVNSVRNVVGGVENSIEDGAKDISNMSKDATNNVEKDAGNTAKSMGNTMNRDTNYNATRTAAEAGSEATFMGITATAWSWIIVAIAIVAIIALVWYYSTQKNNKNHYNE